MSMTWNVHYLNSSNNEVWYRFPEFVAEMDMQDLQFQVEQLFNSIQEFREAVRTYDAVHGYNLKCKANDEKRIQGICKADCNWRMPGFQDE